MYGGFSKSERAEYDSGAERINASTNWMRNFRPSHPLTRLRQSREASGTRSRNRICRKAKVANPTAPENKIQRMLLPISRKRTEPRKSPIQKETANS